MLRCALPLSRHYSAHCATITCSQSWPKRWLRRFTRLANGVYDTIDDPATFRDILTQHLRAVCHDNHLRLVHYIEPQPPRDTDLYADPNALAAY